MRRCRYPRVSSASEFYLFIFIYGFAPIWADLCRTGPIWLELGRIGWIGSYRPTVKTDRNSWNKSKSALNHARTAKIGFEWGPNILNQSFLNFILNICCFFCFFFCFFFLFVLCFVSCLLLSLFCEPRTYNVFFKNILIVKIYRKYK